MALLSFVVLSLAGLWGSTEYVAVHFSAAPALRAPWAVVGTVPVYASWAWLAWSRALETRAPTLLRDERLGRWRAAPRPP